MDKTIRELFEREIDLPCGVSFNEKLGKYCNSDGYGAVAINELFEMFEAGHKAAKASEWVSVEDESLLPDFDVNVQVWVGEYGIERQASARRTKTNNHGDWGWYESNITNTMLTMVTHHKPTVNPKGPSDE